MKIQEITDKNIWESFLLLCDERSFLHSWNWGEFQKSLGYKILRFGIYQAQNHEQFHGSVENLIAVALVIKHVAKRGSFLLVPHGPIEKSKIKNQRSKILEALLEKLKELAKKEKVDFIRISPIWERTAENEKLFKDLGFRLRPLHTHPESSWKLNIEPPEEELLASMRKTTRYLIKQAQKMGVEVFESFDMEDVKIFNKMHLEVAKHQKFVPFSLNYFQKEFQAFAPDNPARNASPVRKDSISGGHSDAGGQIALFFAKYQGKIIAASYGIFWSNMAFYHHAALLPEYKKIPAAYLLQWKAIKEAKRRGCKVYDFWGYSDPVKYPHHPYSGPTLFKMGFGGYKDEYVKTQDFIISPKYWFNYIIEVIRRIKRGL